ncbi:MAG: hypothetical protein GX597_05355 [Anaerolineaceae bacterium]|nr:hypothetical protein [Anaerolineaceae bacterium]
MKLTKKESEHIDAFKEEAGKVLALLDVLQELGLVCELLDLKTGKRAWPMIKRTAAEVDMDWRTEEGRAWLLANWPGRMARKDALHDS